MDDSDLMPFGVHQGEKMGDVPASYLMWFYDQPWKASWPGVLAYAEKNIQWLKKEALSDEFSRPDRDGGGD